MRSLRKNKTRGLGNNRIALKSSEGNNPSSLRGQTAGQVKLATVFFSFIIFNVMVDYLCIINCEWLINIITAEVSCSFWISNKKLKECR